MTRGLTKNPESNKAEIWCRRNSLLYQNTKDYVTNLCKKNFEFKNFEIRKVGREEYLAIEQNEICYILSVEEENRLIKVIKQADFFGNMLTLNVLYFDGAACWYNSLNWIKSDC